MLPGNLSGAPLPALRYHEPITAACQHDFSPCLAYAIAYRETIRGDIGNKWNATNVLSFDGGHGLFQLTSSYPENWADPNANALYAVEHFLLPAYHFWFREMKQTGVDLVRCIAAEFNAGRGGALSGHMAGDVDRFTTDGYALDVANQYHRLIQGQAPV